MAAVIAVRNKAKATKGEATKRKFENEQSLLPPTTEHLEDQNIGVLFNGYVRCSSTFTE